MTDARIVTMTAEQLDDVERYVESLMRDGDTARASRMMVLSLAYKFAKAAEPPLPDNVIVFPGHSVRV